MTTDPPRRRPRMGPVSVRLRITVAVVLLAGLALCGAGLAVYAVESRQLDASINDQISQEFAEFSKLQRDGFDTDGQPFDDIRRLMDVFMERNVPAEDELLIAFWGGEPKLRTGTAHKEMAEDPQIVRAISDLNTTGGSRVLDTDFGETIVAVRPVRDDRRQGALVHVYFTDDAHATLVGTMRTYALIGGACLFLLMLGAYFVAGRLLSPVRELTDTARDISETDLSRRIEVRGNDDLTELTRTANAMLDRLEGAFTAQRRFLDDAGHELRTPITIVRGHLELLDAQDAEEVLTTRNLVLDEVDRMSRLVDDLILLAKAQRPDFIRAAPTDIGTLTDEVAEKIRGLADRDWAVDARAQGKARIDNQRITQALLQLASNAVRHTREQGVIAVGSTMSATHLRMWVRDDGDGIAPEDQERIFERFSRVTGVRDDGSGLGLAIVTAIALAHDGRVELESAPAQGSTFSLVIPLEGA